MQNFNQNSAFNRYFITATDTDCGKTFITAGLLAAFLEKKEKCLAIKPVQSGCEKINSEIIAPDVEEYKKISSENNIAPCYSLLFPASPHYAAKKENITINKNTLTEYLKPYFAENQHLLIEGAGGLLVPLNEKETFLDLIGEIDVEIILVAKNKLGALNNILLNIETIENYGLKIAAIVLNFHDDSDEICLSNLDYLKNKFEIPIISIPKVRKPQEIAANLHLLVEKKTPNSEKIIDLEFDKNHLWHPYTSAIKPLKTYPVLRTDKNKIQLADGRWLIDGMSSWWCAILGYNNYVINQAAIKQIKQMPHIMFGGITHQPAIDLSRKLLNLMPEFNNIFYCDSGSIAVEVAIKIALQYQQNNNPNKTKILTVRGGYHGDSFGAMSVCDPTNGMHFLFKEVLAEQIFAARPNCAWNKLKPENKYNKEAIKEVENIFKNNQEKIAAVIIEPIVQGAGGMWFYRPEFLEDLRILCDKYDALLIFDEIATGFGRTGKLFAYQHTNIAPDIICIGKALTAGFMSFAAVLTNKNTAIKVSENNRPLMHGPTFMANPLACQVANTAIEVLLNSNWYEQVQNIEKYLIEYLSPAKELKQVKDVRILGAIGVVEVEKDVNCEIAQEFFVRQGVWIRPFAKNIYLMPPYISSQDDIKKLCDAIIECIKLNKY
ncbi:MAG: adenosylmethionine--8-amino-7-oxononanoate transaminase [Cardiobacteriaceae bacterium]|nr:adenosylmethionine--8-amino-7-oxononanoate transaminase [Cardiobacteriaceae bacterium]